MSWSQRRRRRRRARARFASVVEVLKIYYNNYLRRNARSAATVPIARLRLHYTDRERMRAGCSGYAIAQAATLPTAAGRRVAMLRVFAAGGARASQRRRV